MTPPASDNGWVKTHRKLLDWPWFRHPAVAHFWEYCRLKASHQARKGVAGMQEVDLQPGQFIFGRRVAAEETGLSERQVRTALSKLQTSKCLKSTHHSTKQFSIITICNWESYQTENPPSDQRFDQPATKQRPTRDQPATTDKNVKNVKNGKKEEETALAPTRKTEPKPTLAWNPESGWSNITDGDREEWAAAYPACDLDRQLAAASAWLRANPTKARKSNWRRFITNWLSRSQERGGDAPRGNANGTYPNRSNSGAKSILPPSNFNGVDPKTDFGPF